MIIDCDQCVMQNTVACSDCVVTAFLGSTPVEIDHDQSAALGHLADAGLVAPLRLVRRPSGRESAAG